MKEKKIAKLVTLVFLAGIQLAFVAMVLIEANKKKSKFAKYKPFLDSLAKFPNSEGAVMFAVNLILENEMGKSFLTKKQRKLVEEKSNIFVKFVNSMKKRK